MYNNRVVLKTIFRGNTVLCIIILVTKSVKKVFFYLLNKNIINYWTFSKVIAILIHLIHTIVFCTRLLIHRKYLFVRDSTYTTKILFIGYIKKV